MDSVSLAKVVTAPEKKNHYSFIHISSSNCQNIIWFHQPHFTENSLFFLLFLDDQSNHRAHGQPAANQYPRFKRLLFSRTARGDIWNSFIGPTLRYYSTSSSGPIHLKSHLGLIWPKSCWLVELLNLWDKDACLAENLETRRAAWRFEPQNSLVWR